MLDMTQMVRRRRREWTKRDDELLRKFHAEGKSDPDIGYILDRHPFVVRWNRKKLGLPPSGKRGGMWKGFRHSPEAKEKISAANRLRWKSAEREKLLAAWQRGLEKHRATQFRLPPKGTPEFKLYRKVRLVLGPAAARELVSP